MTKMTQQRVSNHSKLLVIGITGPVASGKSTYANTLIDEFAKQGLKAVVVSTDNFLFPNAELERRGLMLKKGFPESHDIEALKLFITHHRHPEIGIADAQDLTARNLTARDLSTHPNTAHRLHHPLYDHQRYDIIGHKSIDVEEVDVLILEGVGLSGLLDKPTVGLLDELRFFDANIEDCEKWYLERCIAQLNSAREALSRGEQESYYTQFAQMSDTEFIERARQVWKDINLPNYEQNIKPLRKLADLVIQVDAKHRITVNTSDGVTSPPSS
jgi:type I pantothenate kinase